eukprot:956762-Pyramimonas_sp.AAC.2
MRVVQYTRGTNVLGGVSGGGLDTESPFAGEVLSGEFPKVGKSARFRKSGMHGATCGDVELCRSVAWPCPVNHASRDQSEIRVPYIPYHVTNQRSEFRIFRIT